MRSIFWAILLFVFVLACSTDTSDIPTLEVGQDFADSNVRLVSIDTFTVEVSTFRFDSIITSGTDRVLVGQYQDSFFGKVRSSSFFELSTSDYNLPDDAELDSIGLVLGYNTYFYNDTLALSEINVHLLNDEVRIRDDFFYNTSTIAFDSIPLQTITFTPEPIDEDSLYIPLPFDFGEVIFDGILDNTINSTEDLREIFEGFTIQPGRDDNSSVIGFSSNLESTYLRFFYRIPDEFDDVEETFDLFIQEFEGPKVFNNIQSDISGTVLDTLTDQEINLPSTRSNNRSFIQSGTGYATRIQFPTIKKLFDIPGTGTILNATLQIKPPPNTYDDNVPIRDSLSINLIDQNNVITEQLFFGGQPVFGIIDRERREFDELVYEIPIGVYIDRELNETNIVDDAFVVFPPDYGQSVDRIVIEGEKSEEFSATLILTYAIYEE
ncbi:DUF4270 family protein [Flagellimonas allohymeniacidonis]|uniref:DUF4270 family protein n=1 Tax=Flagellimonas allohymeniacidonis TaxID=2517819 RepID=A0A4Q8QFT7_9FLAO|nr:DUF4270 family protein [Allomuricauda hymeniacidonis]TAI47199.1 DUF4270 family protein [Allomuricauda hymeniacidonis]